ncbi:MAG: hypothetical protein AAF928_08675 [Myxococcota bacterium]
MRGTIVGVFAVVVLIVSVLSFGLMRFVIGDVSNRGQAQRGLQTAALTLERDALRIERWLGQQGASDAALEPFALSAASARSDAATTAANTVEERTRSEPTFSRIKPALIVLYGPDGVVMGRNGSALMRGEKLAERHPEILDAVKQGTTGSAVWLDKAHNEQLLVSFAPVRKGKDVVGGVLIGTALSDERLQRILGADADVGLLAAAVDGDAMSLVAKSSEVTEAMERVVAGAPPTLDPDQMVTLPPPEPGHEAVGVGLAGYGGKVLMLIGVSEIQTVGGFGSLLGPVLGVLALGLLLVVVGAFLIDNYISQPISDLEDGLLAVINGQTDLRFELEHKVLGGLGFRINSLLNQLLGVAEDDTDETGRPSVAPSSSRFTEALSVDERMASLSLEDVADGRMLRDEPAESYYGRLFDEYLAAKRALGDPVDAIRLSPFVDRIKSLEADMSGKHGKPFRYRVEASGGEVVLVAVPLA